MVVGAAETSRYQDTSQAAGRDPNPCQLSGKAGKWRVSSLCGGGWMG